MPQQYFSYTGPATNGQTVSWLTAEEAFALQAKEDQMKKDADVKAAQQLSDTRLAPVMNKQISDYAKEKGLTQADLQGSWDPVRYATDEDVAADTTGKLKKGYQMPRIETDPISKAFADIQSGNENTTALEDATAVRTQPQANQPQAAPASFQQKPAGMGLRDDTEQLPTQPKGSLQSMLSGLPDDIVRPLLIQYNSGDISPAQAYKQVKELLATQNEIKNELEKERMKAEIKKESSSNKGFGGSSVGAALAFTEAHPELVEEGNRIIDRLKAEGAYSETLLDSFRSNLKTDVRQGLRDLTNLQGRTESAIRTLEETTPGQAELAARKAEAAQKAKTLGLKTLDQKDEQFIMSTRSAYDDIAYARSKFKDEFATPYIGKLIKISALKQLGTEFTDFIGSVEKGTATYRKENFGTAQTGTELQNLKDIIDKDMAVRPEVLLTQIDKFLSTAERDYKDRVNYLNSHKYYVADDYQQIGIRKGGMAPAPAAPAPATTSTGGIMDKFIKDQIYTDAGGNRARYLGNGQWEEVK